MKIFKQIKLWKDYRLTLTPNNSLGVVMTMGSLHQGHLSLIKQSQKDNDYTLVTIFVNQAQFSNKNDFITYPNNLPKDIVFLKNYGVDFLLAPYQSEIYQDNYSYQINEKKFSQILCGRSRPGHFNAVLTIVMKFLQLAQAHRAYFGEKDYQQAQLIQGMAKAFFISTKIISCPIIRDKNGLAYSSRNVKLTDLELKKANKFSKIISKRQTLEEVKESLINENINIDYLEDHYSRRFAAVTINNIRLIDNVVLDKNSLDSD